MVKHKQKNAAGSAGGVQGVTVGRAPMSTFTKTLLLVVVLSLIANATLAYLVVRPESRGSTSSSEVAMNEDGTVDNISLQEAQIAGSLPESEEDEATTRASLGSFYMEEGSYDKALEQFLEAEKLGLNDGPLYTNVAIAAEKSGDKKRALEYHKKALEEYNKNAEFNPGNIADTNKWIETLENGGDNF